MDEISLSINGQRVTCPSGASILDAALENGISIPTLCHHPDLRPSGACRLCLVEDAKSCRVLASCVTPAAPDMEIATDSPRVIRHRKNIVRMMMAEHPESCIVCNKGNRCRLREIAARLGIGETGLYPMPNHKELEAENPFISRDLTKCVLCGRCIRADHELVVAGAIDYNLRGFRSRPATLHDLPLERSDCTFCGTCVSICPTGALTVKGAGSSGTPERETYTTCGFCGVGCSLLAGASGGRIVEMNPAGLKDSVNGSTLCVRGHFAHDFLNSPERLLNPMIRKEGRLEPVPWEEALSFTARRLTDIRKEYGPQSIGLIGSSKCTNEENYLFQKMARVILGTNNVDNGGYLAGRPALSVIHERTGGECRVNPITNLIMAESMLVVGADPDHSAPVLGYSIRRAAKNGTPLIVADPRKTALARQADLWLPVSPGRDCHWINCLSALLWKDFAHDPGFIEQFTDGFALFIDALTSVNPERLCVTSEIDMSLLQRAAALLKGRKIALIVGHGITLQAGGARAMDALLNLSLMTGSIASGPGGLHIIGRDSNQAGAWDMGAVPHMLPGREALGNHGARKKWERVWRANISPDEGLNLIRMVEESEKGNLKALYVMGENPLRGLPRPDRVRKALEGLDFLVVQDILDNETTRMADVVLPGAAICEKDGSVTNMEGRINSFTRVVPPPGEGKPDWEILDLLAARMNGARDHEGYGSLRALRSEIRRNLALYSDLKERPSAGPSWIRSGNTRRLFSPDGQGSTIPFTPAAPSPAEIIDDEYPFTAILGSHRFHLGSGTRTGRSKRIREFHPGGELELSPGDGASMNLGDGDMVRVESRYGYITRAIRLTQGVRPGLIFVPTAFNGNDAMNLLPLIPMEDPGSPGLKTCRVRMKKIPSTPEEGDEGNQDRERPGIDTGERGK